MRPLGVLGLLAVLASAACATLSAPGYAIPETCPDSASAISLSGFVRDTAGTPLVGVNVLVFGSCARAVTDSSGHYTLAQVPIGRVRVRAQVLGYAPREIVIKLRRSDAAAHHLDIVLARCPCPVIIVGLGQSPPSSPVRLTSACSGGPIGAGALGNRR